MEHNKDKDHETGSNLVNWVIRLILFAIVLGITSFLTPGFSINGMWAFLLAALVITVVDYFVESLMGENISPLGTGLKGFIISAIIIYLVQFIVPHMSVTIIGALIASLIIGIIDAIIPKRVM